jgi:hypothetical protein
MVPVYEYSEMPNDIKVRLKAYYKNTDLRILNGAYTRYPFIFDFDRDNLLELDKHFKPEEDHDTEYVIIHWEW